MLRIAILGRPNVGKSSLFNRLCAQSLAIVNEEEGTTRDRLVGKSNKFDFETTIIDTGGVDQNSSDRFQKEIAKQAFIAAKEADLILLVTDVRCGVTEEDERLAKAILPLQKPIILVANKLDTPRDQDRFHEFYNLGISVVVGLSAAHNKHLDFLVRTITKQAQPLFEKQSLEEPLEENEETFDPEDLVVPDEEFEENLDEEVEEGLLQLETSGFDDKTFSQFITISQKTSKQTSQETPVIKIALIGRPNVGKSSLINALLQEDRCLTDNIPGTTRDNVDVLYSHDTGQYLFIDTAGLRKPKSIKNSVEWISTSRTEKAISRADLCLLVIDGTMNLSSYDKRILSLITKAKKPFIILVNKWDLVKSVRMEHYVKALRDSDPLIQDAAVLCVSASTQRNLNKIFATVQGIYGIATRKIPTSLINKALSNIMAKHPPQLIAKRRLRIYYAVQKSFAPPLFLLFINAKALLTKTYEHYLKNKMREAFNFYGIPFDIELKEKPKRYK